MFITLYWFVTISLIPDVRFGLVEEISARATDFLGIFLAIGGSRLSLDVDLTRADLLPCLGGEIYRYTMLVKCLVHPYLESYIVEGLGLLRELLPKESRPF